MLTDGRFGTDLHLIHNPLARQASRFRGSDLEAVMRRESTAGGMLADLGTLTADQNLEQALLLRFLTPVGELSALGHPEYGSRLFELIGELNNVTNRNRAKLFVLQALGQEPRVKQVQSVTVTQNSSDKSQVDIKVALTAINQDTPLNLVFGFSFQGPGA